VVVPQCVLSWVIMFASHAVAFQFDLSLSIHTIVVSLLSVVAVSISMDLKRDLSWEGIVFLSIALFLGFFNIGERWLIFFEILQVNFNLLSRFALSNLSLY